MVILLPIGKLKSEATETPGRDKVEEPVVQIKDGLAAAAPAVGFAEQGGNWVMPISSIAWP